MITQHFFKVLTIFVGMIILGLLGIILISYFEKEEAVPSVENNKVAEIAE